MRWAGGRTFAAAIERQAVRATLMKADRAGTLDETEDELFRFARLVEGDPALRDALGGRGVPLANRQVLVSELLTGRATEATVTLAKRAVLARERTFGHTIEGFVTLAADHKNRVVATVRVARALLGRAARAVAGCAQPTGRARGRDPGDRRTRVAGRDPGRTRWRSHRGHGGRPARAGTQAVRMSGVAVLTELNSQN